MKDILSEIVANKRFEIDLQKQIITSEKLKDMVEEQPRSFRSMRHSLEISSSGIIAEFKRRSPSKGWINREARSEEIPVAYEKSGAAALSILTDETYFGGSLRDIRNARPKVQLPILRKDFILDEYQLLQAYVTGADAILLIAACLEKEKCAALTAQAHELGLEVLLEIHCESELEYITEHIDMTGINNRNLGTFVTDIQNSFTLAEQLNTCVENLSQRPLLVSESGISAPESVKSLRQVGFRGFLIGETFMKTENPGDTLHTFIKAIEA